MGSLQTPEYVDPEAFAQMTDDHLRSAVKEVVAGQKQAGIDIIDEGELTKGGIWVTYVHKRFGGFEQVNRGRNPRRIPDDR